MGSGSSTSNTTPFTANTNQYEKEFFLIYPEEAIVKQQIQVSEDQTPKIPSKENYIFSAEMINDLFLNFPILTQEKSQLEVFQKIIIPNFSQCIWINTDLFFLLKNKLTYNKGYSNYFAEIHNQFLSNYHFAKKRKFTISMQIEKPIIEIADFNNIYKTIVNPKTNIFDFAFQTNSIKQTNPSFIDLIQQNPTDFSLLVNSFFFSLYNNDVYQLLITMKLLLALSTNETFKNCPNISFNQTFQYPQIKISNDLYQGTISYPYSPLTYKLPSEFPANILAVTPTFLFLYNPQSSMKQSPHILQISLTNNNVTDNATRFTTIKLDSSFFSTINYSITSVDNCLLVIDNKYNLSLLDMSNPSKSKLVTSQMKDKLERPFTSDGHFIYSFLSHSEIGVYELARYQKLEFIRKIKLNDNSKSGQLKKPFNGKLIDQKMLRDGLLITNGIELSIIMPLDLNANNGQYTYFVRTISLLTGNHISDDEVKYQNLIHSICLEPISKRIWIASCFPDGVKFDALKYTGPEPLWLSNLQCITKFDKKTKITSGEFVQFATSYLHAILAPIFGCKFENDDPVLNFFLGYGKQSEVVELIFDLLELHPNNYQLIECLLIILSNHISFSKLQTKHFDQLKKIFKCIHVSALRNFIKLYIIRLTNVIPYKYISQFYIGVFQCISQEIHDKVFNLLLISTQLENSRQFPYVLDNMHLSHYLNILFNPNIVDDEFNFISNYQASIFRTFSYTLQHHPQNLKPIQFVAITYSSQLIQLAIGNQNQLTNPFFSQVFSKFLLFLKLTFDAPSFYRPVLPLLFQLMQSYLDRKIVDFNKLNNKLSPITNLFLDVYFYYILCYKKMITFNDLEILKKYEQFLNIKIGEEKTISEIFDNQINNDEFKSVVNTLYQKVSHPINKRLTAEDKEFESLIFLSIIYQTGLKDKVIELHQKIKNNEPIALPKEISQMVRDVYGIRSNLRSKKQNADQTLYLNKYKSISDKSNFLLKLDPTNGEEKSIIDFINNDLQIAELIVAKNKLGDLQQNMSMFIDMADNLFNAKFPPTLLYLLMTYVSDNSDLFDAYDVLCKYTKINITRSEEFIAHILSNLGQMPPNALICFICLLLLLLSRSYGDSELHNLYFRFISTTMESLIVSSSSGLPRFVFRSNFVVLCHFIRIIHDNKLFMMTPAENQQLRAIVQKLSLKDSMSFKLSHSLRIAFLKPVPRIDMIDSLIGLISQPKFHSLSILLYDHLLECIANSENDRFNRSILTILEIIGSVFSGAQSDKLLQIAVESNILSHSLDNNYVRTSTSQIACALELVQIIRRLLLDKNSPGSQIIAEHFNKWSQIQNLEQDNRSIQLLFGMLVVMSNITEIIRPYTIVTTNENKTYLVVSLDFTGYELNGVLLPISESQIVQHKIHATSELKSNEIIPYNLSRFSHIDIPYRLFEMAAKLNMNHYSDSLFTFFALRCVRENLLDPDCGALFSDGLLVNLQDVQITQFNFRENAPLVLSLLKKSLVTKTEGIFVGSLVKPKFFHAAYTQLVFEDDYYIDDKTITTNSTSHVFISSILDDTNPIYFSFRLARQYHIVDFGVITHSVDQNQSVSVTYSAPEVGFCVNGERAHQQYLEDGTLIECRYYPTKNKVSFACDHSDHPLFVLRLQPHSRCSFIVFLYSHSMLNYQCSFEPETQYFKKTIQLKQIFKPGKLVKRIVNNVIKKKKYIDESETKFLTLSQEDIEENSEEIINYSATNNLYAKNTSDIIFSKNTEDANAFASFSKLRETQVYLTISPNCLYQSKLNVYSTPQSLGQYIQVNDVSGRYHCISSEMASMEAVDSIPSFHFDKYPFLPIEVINCYFSGVCEIHRQEVLTLFIARILANARDIELILNQFSITSKMLVKFVTSILLLLEPIKVLNLNENKSPIDFETFNGFETCSKAELYDYHSGLTHIINYLQNSNRKTEFIEAWLTNLQKDFKNKYMHFATQRNGKVRIVRSSIRDNFQNFVEEDANGWFIFPIEFGCSHMPFIEGNHIVFPKSFDDKVNYAYNDSNLLHIMFSSYNQENPNRLFAFGLLPFSTKSNESLFHTFYQLAISFKYFVLFSSRYLTEDQKIMLRDSIFTAISAASPFFYSHSDSILSFLDRKLPMSFTPRYISLLNRFIGSTSIYNQLNIDNFISNQISLYEDVKASIYRYYLSDTEEVPVNKELPKNVFPITLSYNNSSSNNLLVLLRRVLIRNDQEFPFYLILNEWAESFSIFPPCDTEFVEPNVLLITFKAYVPERIYLVDQDLNPTEDVEISYTSDFARTQNAKMNSIPTQKPQSCQSPIENKAFMVTEGCTFNKVYVKFHHENLAQHNMIVGTESIKNHQIPILAYNCRSFFSVDLNEWQNDFTANDDQQILAKIPPNYYQQDTVSTRISPVLLCSMDTQTHRTHMIRLRAIFLNIFNFMCSHDHSILNTCTSEMLQRFLSIHFIAGRFMSTVEHYSTENCCYITINRTNGYAVRQGLSTFIHQSMIGQFTSYYFGNKNKFKNCERLFHVQFSGENGVDCGGLMREFASEIVKDIGCANVGLFAITPNGRAHQGKWQECLIPTPDPRISNPRRCYEAIGAFISMSIRCCMRQSGFEFPPLFWKFIITGELSIDDIYDIDKAYRTMITNIMSAAETMSDSDFESMMAGIVLTNLRGTQISVSANNRDLAPSRLKRCNVQRFIALSNESRMNELKIPLQSIRTGFWENMGFTPPRYVSPTLIEYLACGDKIITVSSLREVVRFDGVSLKQINYFWKVVERMSNEDRKKLLQFSTGIQSIDRQHGLIVDSIGGHTYRLPTASTCFFKLHLPSYRNENEMYRALHTAINETQSFENS